MAIYHHGTIRKYTAALLDVFNDIEIQYGKSTGDVITRPIPIVYSTREKARLLDSYTSEQLISGNYSVLPRASLSLNGLAKAESRVTNKNHKISKYKTDDVLEYSFNSVPYEFTFDITIQCRGMNEATQIIEQIAPRFNPTLNIDIWDAGNLDEPTRIPIKLSDIGIESEEYDELSSNIFTITISLSMMGNIYPPIKDQERIKEFQMRFSQYDGEYSKQLEILEWDVDLDGYIMGGGPITLPDGTVVDGTSGTTLQSASGVSLQAARVAVIDAGEYWEGTTVEEILQEIGLADFQKKEEKGQPNGYASLDAFGRVPLSQLPTYGSEVQEHPDLASLPAVGDTSVIYVTQDTGNVYMYDEATMQYQQIDSFVDLAKEATQLSQPREITVNLDGYSSGSALFDGSGDISINLTSTTKVITTPRLPIVDNSATLPSKSLEDIDNAYIYQTAANVASVFECTMSEDGFTIYFDPADNLNGFECTVRYFAAI